MFFFVIECIAGSVGGQVEILIRMGTFAKHTLPMKASGDRAFIFECKYSITTFEGSNAMNLSDVFMAGEGGHR